MNGKKGITLIELIIFIVVAGLFVPLAYVAFSHAIRSATTPESVLTARFIAEQKIEDITKVPFDTIVSTYNPPVNTGYSSVSGYPGYQWRWEIRYITYSGTPPNIVIENSTNSTDYLLIVVRVKEPNGFEYIVNTIATKRPT